MWPEPAPAWTFLAGAAHEFARRKVITCEVGVEREHDIDLVRSVVKCLLDLLDDVVGSRPSEREIGDRGTAIPLELTWSRAALTNLG